MDAPPVTVLRCYVTPNALTRQASGVDIAYVNKGPTTLHRVTFKVKYHTIDADIEREVVDAGTFAPGVAVDHHFDALEGQSFIPASPTECTPTDAH